MIAETTTPGLHGHAPNGDDFSDDVWAGGAKRLNAATEDFDAAFLAPDSSQLPASGTTSAKTALEPSAGQPNTRGVGVTTHGATAHGILEARTTAAGPMPSATSARAAAAAKSAAATAAANRSAQARAASTVSVKLDGDEKGGMGGAGGAALDANEETEADDGTKQGDDLAGHGGLPKPVGSEGALNGDIEAFTNPD